VGARAVTPVFLLVVALAAPAAAHIGLLYPPSRYGDSVLKEGPCGATGGTRSGNVTELESGARIDVTWDEYVDHPGHFRVAFDVDGDDDFVDPACLSGCNTRSPEIATYSNPTVLLDGIADTADGGLSTVTLTLPDVECDRCTLQVIQVMYDKPPYEVGGNDLYYQCADLILRRTAPPGCPGDCNGDHRVTVEELIAGIGISLGSAALGTCNAFDPDGDGRVGVAEIVRAVAAALGTCAP
jgi:hypothetical protein